MRRILALTVLMIAVAAPARAQSPAVAPAADARPPALEIIDDSVQPEVTIAKRGKDTVTEHRINGRLYKITVTPEHGLPYTLIDPTGEGSFVPLDSSPSPMPSVPMWVIGTF